MDAVRGYWYTPYGGEREWRDAPRCSCGGEVDTRPVKAIADANENETIAEIVCQSCDKVQLTFMKSGAEAIARGVELAKEHGW